MFKKVIITMLVLVCGSTIALAQTASVAPYGMSPRDAASDTLDIFDLAYNGLLNVGVETQMYLKGTVSGATLAPTWTVTTKPTGSVAAITVTADMDTVTQIAVFKPDVVGSYVVEFANGGASASVTINAGTYVGASAGDGNCVVCHKSKGDEWMETGHYSLFENGLNGIASDHYSASCISCHTTGYDVNADNNGFDDRGFVFPDSLYPGQYANMVVAYPNAMKLARIQCESCHGPGSAHNGVVSDSKMVSSIDAADCALCHDSGHHSYPNQWDVSRHGNPLYMARGASASCAPCHSGSGFVAWVKGGKENLASAPDVTPITCATCHEPHSDEIAHQLRTADVTLADGETVSVGGLGKLCMNCHKSRVDAAVYTGPNFSYSSHYGPHHGPQAEILLGMNMPTFGKNIPSSAHKRIENACVTCHMAENEEVDQAKIAGGHSFRMVTPEGMDNVEACVECHGEVGESFGEKKFYMNGVADHDGDGVEEGLQEEVEGMLEELGMMLPPLGDPEVDISGTYVYTQTDAKAAYNWFAVEEDRSLGIHNPAFVVGLLKVSMQAVENHGLAGGIVEIMDVPNDQGKQVRIVWNKTADDGVAIDPVMTYVVKRDDGDDTWTNVGEVTADGSGRYALVVPTVYDSTAMGNAMTAFKVVAVSKMGEVQESEPTEGYSVDNLVPHAPGSVVLAQAPGGDISIEWEAPADPDVNYYMIYRTWNRPVVADASTLIGTTTSLEFNDTVSQLGVYRYKVRAVDFSGNLGELSVTVNATLTSVAAKDNSMPTEFALKQNYPNPFNPDTKIDFAVKEAGHITITVYNTLGQQVSTLVDEAMAAGNYMVNFNAAGLTSGEYIYRIEVRGNAGIQFQDIRKMVLMK